MALVEMVMDGVPMSLKTCWARLSDDMRHPDCHRQYCSALDSCFTVVDVCSVVGYFHKYKVLLHAFDARRCMNNRCTESLLVQLVRFRTVCGLGPNRWWFERLVRM